MESTAVPISQSLVLVGAGNAHLQIIKKWKMAPMKGVQLTVVNETALIPYSGMVPGFLAGRYSAKEIHVDLRRFCVGPGLRFIEAKVDRVELLSKEVWAVGRPPLGYDVLSLNVGSTPTIPAGGFAANHALLTKPLSRFIQQIEAIEIGLSPERPFHFCVVGGGAGGCELAMALHARWKWLHSVKVSLIHTGSDLGGRGMGLAQRISRILQAQGIALHSGRVVGADSDSIHLESGEKIPCQGFVWATDAGALDWIRRSRLSVDYKGFIKVRDTLQSVDDPIVFAVGDCAALVSRPGLEKSGVYAVRQGPTLWKNLRAVLSGRVTKPFRPQRTSLALLNTADGKAIASIAGLAFHNRLAWKWKDRIDRAWMEKFQTTRAMSGELMRCGGCGSKVSSRVLGSVLEQIEIPRHPDILVGCREGEDASVQRTPRGDILLQTVDFFRAFIDDPYLLGRIAAVNALSDIFAMNGKPATALAIATVPVAATHIQEEWLAHLLAGVNRVLQDHAVILTGGHTTEGNEIGIGLSVSGFAERDALFRKGGLVTGDTLILTKPLGSGAIFAASMRGEADSEVLSPVLESCLQSNGAAAPILARYGVRAGTDITGFGLVGHLLEMLDRSGVSANLQLNKVPVFAGFPELTKRGIFSTLHAENRRSGSRLVNENDLEDAVLFDPQTSGGFLFGVSTPRAEEVLRDLWVAGFQSAGIIGTVESGTPVKIRVIA